MAVTTAIVGSYSLSFAMLAALVAMMAALGAAVLRTPGMFRAARWSMGAVAALLSVASAALLVALVQSDFRLAYVAEYTERALPLGYKLAAFWAGQQGSLLFWAWMLAAMTVVFLVANRKDDSTEHAVTILVLAAVCTFFVVLMLMAIEHGEQIANPFQLAAVAAVEGQGLNPMLQNVAMLAHPPTLFVGYAGFTIPFAMMVGALVAGSKPQQWVVQARRWTLAAWLFLSVGILLGSWWAYLELGWGGYWAWDPVENASLLPWLTGTALLHSIMVQERRNMFRVWNPVLAALTFLLCIFGTYLTRSGVMSSTSVHSFPKSVLGEFFLVFLTLCVIVTVVLILCRLRTLRLQRPLESLLSREAALLGGNILLVAMMAWTLYGTIRPLLASMFGAKSMTATVDYYNVRVLPLGLLLAGLMGVGPLLAYGTTQTQRFVRGVLLPLAVALTAAIGTWALDGWTLSGRSLAAVSSAIVVSVIAVGLAMDFVRGLLGRMRNEGEGPLRAALVMLDANHRHWGGYLVHAGVALIIAGIAGSSLYKTKQDVQFGPGQSAQVGSYTLTLQAVGEAEGQNYSSIQATVLVKDGKGAESVLKPERRFYPTWKQPSSEVAYLTGWREDLYLTLGGWEDGGRITAIQATINPLVLWLWIGSLVLTIGGTFCLLPRLLPAARRAQDEAAGVAPSRAGEPAGMKLKPTAVEAIP